MSQRIPRENNKTSGKRSSDVIRQCKQRVSIRDFSPLRESMGAAPGVTTLESACRLGDAVTGEIPVVSILVSGAGGLGMGVDRWAYNSR